MSEYRVRLYEAADQPALISLIRNFQNHLAESDTADEVHSFQSDEDVLRYFEQMRWDVENREGNTFVAHDETGLVGFISGIVRRRPEQADVMFQTTHAPTVQGWIGLLFVLPNQRGQGIGRALMDKMKSYFLNMGCNSMRLLVAHDNPGAVEMYRRYGMSEQELEMAITLR